MWNGREMGRGRSIAEGNGREHGNRKGKRHVVLKVEKLINA